MQSIVRTAVAILCGFLAMTLVVITGTVVAASAFVTGGLITLQQAETPLPTLYLLANLGVSFAAAVLGGWLASRLDAPSRWRPVVGLAILVLVMSVANQAVPRSSGGAPVSWYPFALILLGVTGTLAGGLLRMRSAGVSSPVRA